MEVDLKGLETAIFGPADGKGVDPGIKLADILDNAFPLVWAAAGILLLAYLIFGGFQYMTSAGDPKRTMMARGKITSGLIGFIIVFVAFWIVQLIGILFGIDSVKLIFK